MKLVISLALLALSWTAYAATNAVVMPAGEIKWTPVPGTPGVQTATVEGDAFKGAHHAFMKFDAGFEAPLHHHSSNHFVTVIAGTLILNIDGKDHTLPAGSYFAFKNKGAHKTACAAGAECILFTDVRGKWDVVPAKK